MKEDEIEPLKKVDVTPDQTAVFTFSDRCLQRL